jgi:hypothetical protein
MLINENIKSLFSNKGSNNYGSKLFNLPSKKLNIQSRNINNLLIKENTLNRNSFNSTTETTPRTNYQQEKSSKKTDLDDTLSQLSQILNGSNKDRNFSGLIGKFPGIYDEPEYDKILYYKSKINKAKNLSKKIKVIKLNISNISSKEIFSNTNSKTNKSCLSDRVKIGKKSNDIADATCCFF